MNAQREHVWLGSSVSPILVGAGAVITAVCAGLIVNGAFNGDFGLVTSTAVVGVLIVLVCAAFARVTIAIDSSEVRVRSLLGFPLRRIPLTTITQAGADNQTISAWGGVGYRVSPRGTGLITRGGPALRLTMGSSAFYVSVDHAGEAAEFVNARLGA